jgi:hypothetical protein
MKVFTASGSDSINFSRRSIYKTFIVGLIVVGILVLLASGLLLYMGSLLQKGSSVGKTNQPVSEHTQALLSGLQQTVRMLEEGTTNGKKDCAASIDDVWQKQVAPFADSIRLIANTWEVSDQKRTAHHLLDKTHALREKLNGVSAFSQTVEFTSATVAEATVASTSALDSTIVVDAYANGVVRDAVRISYNPQLASFMSTEILPLREGIKNNATALIKGDQQKTKDLLLQVNQYVSLLKKMGILLLVSLLVAVLVLLRKIQVRIKKNLGVVNAHLGKLAQGIIPDRWEALDQEMTSTVESINLLATNLRSVSEFAKYVGQGNFDSDIKVFDEAGELGGSLARMRDGLKQVSEQDKIRSWTNEGLARFGGIMRENDQNLATLSDQLICNLVKYLNANQGGVFVANNDDRAKPFLELTACYAFERKKFLQKNISSGQGLVGQVWQEGQSIYLREIPDSYVQITSGLGGARPRFLLIVPLKTNGAVHGVLELASFHDFHQYMIDFVEKIAETIASSIAGTRVAEQTRLLLQEAQQMTEQMRAQEEEMRQNMEELQATQEEMHRSQRETAQNLEVLKKEKEVLLKRIEELEKGKK